MRASLFCPRRPGAFLCKLASCGWVVLSLAWLWRQAPDFVGGECKRRPSTRHLALRSQDPERRQRLRAGEGGGGPLRAGLAGPGAACVCVCRGGQAAPPAPRLAPRPPGAVSAAPGSRPLSPPFQQVRARERGRVRGGPARLSRSRLPSSPCAPGPRGSAGRCSVLVPAGPRRSPASLTWLRPAACGSDARRGGSKFGAHPGGPPRSVLGV